MTSLIGDRVFAVSGGQNAISKKIEICDSEINHSQPGATLKKYDLDAVLLEGHQCVRFLGKRMRYREVHKSMVQWTDPYLIIITKSTIISSCPGLSTMVSSWIISRAQPVSTGTKEWLLVHPNVRHPRE